MQKIHQKEFCVLSGRRESDAHMGDRDHSYRSHHVLPGSLHIAGMLNLIRASQEVATTPIVRAEPSVWSLNCYF